MKTYLGLYLGAMLVTFLATKLVIALAGKWHLLDLPGVRKVHPRPVPRIGGIAIFLGMLGPLLAVLVLSNAIGDAFRESQTRFLALLGCSWTSRICSPAPPVFDADLRATLGPLAI
jgi:UDP-N-acetylmuramyl pentapeptide phosphotransferase/UDP-N-acetylglucosamine-1-phosphate transferase